MTPLRVVVVDDEAIARRRLKRLLSALGGVEVVGEAGDGRTALSTIADTAPDAVLLDIQMPEASGLDVSRRLAAPRPLVVFVTAYDRFAVQAFDVQAVDYLLKPVSDARLAAAIDRIRDRLRSDRASPGRAPSRSAGSRRPLERLPVRAEGYVELVALASVDWIEAAGNYAVVHAGRTSHVMRETLANLERDLDPDVFVRIHRSTIVRLDRIRRLDVAQRGDYVVRLTDGTTLALSRTHRGRLEQALGRRV